MYVIFVVYPFFYTIYLSLTKWDGAKPVKEFVGLLNYERLFADPRLWSALSHNLIWIVLGTVTPVAIGLFLGVLLWRGRARYGLLPHRLFFAGGVGAGRRRHHLEVDVQSAIWPHKCRR